MVLTATAQTEEPPARDAAPAIRDPAPFNWSDTAVARLRQLWTDGHTAAQIAREIGGLSRAAVIGKARRLGLDSRRAAAPRDPGAISAVPRRTLPGSEMSRAEKARRQRARALARRQARHEQVCPEPAPPETPPPANPPCALLELNRDTCRWPIGDPAAGFHFCGAFPDADHPYCAHHRRIPHWRPDPSAPGAPRHGSFRAARLVDS